MQKNGSGNRRVGQPVGDPAPTQVSHPGGKSENGREYPNSLIHSIENSTGRGRFGEPVSETLRQRKRSGMTGPSLPQSTAQGRDRGALFRSALIFLAFSANCRACGRSSSPL